MGQNVKGSAALIGVGRWGKNIARELAERKALSAYALLGNEENAAWVTREIPSAVRKTMQEIVDDKSITSVFIATPIATHADIALQMLGAHKHVFVEKPLAERSLDAEKIINSSHEHGQALMVGYIFLYHPVYLELKKRLQDDTVKRLECVWNKYGTFSESIEFNLLTHHLALACDLLGPPRSGRYVKKEAVVTPCDIVETELVYEKSLFESKINRAAESRLHHITIETEKHIYHWEENTFTCDKNLVFTSAKAPLACEIDAFFDLVGGKPASSGGDFGLRVLRIHEFLM